MTTTMNTETMEMIINRAILAVALAAKTLNGVENASELVAKVLSTHPGQTVQAVMPMAELISNACSLRGNSSTSDTINKAIIAVAFAAKQLHGLENASDLVAKALLSHSGSTVQAVVPIADMLSNACLMRLLPIPSVGSNSGASSSGSNSSSCFTLQLEGGSLLGSVSKTVVVRKAASSTSFKPRSMIETMPLSFCHFAHFALDTEEGAKPITENEFFIAETLYDSADYITSVEKKDATAPKFGAYKAAKEAEYKARGLCFDKQTFMFKTVGVASSLKAKAALWTKYSTCCDLLMGFKRYERVAVGEPPAKRSKAASASESDEDNLLRTSLESTLSPLASASSGNDSD